MQAALLVMAGGGLGALGRWLLGRALFALTGPGLPWGTFAANIFGGLAMGLLVGWLAREGGAGQENWRLFIGVGVLGGFTTFSSFTLEIALMVERGELLTGLGYAVASATVALLALFSGLWLMRGMA